MSKATVAIEKDFKSLSLNAPKTEPNVDLFSGINSSYNNNKKDQQTASSLFDDSILSKNVQNQLPDGYIMRSLCLEDYRKGMMDCLAQLTTVGNVTEQEFTERFEYMRKRNDEYFVIVIEELKTSKIVASGTILVEKKFIRGCGSVGHIEDIVVHDSQRGKSYGKRIIEQLTHIGQIQGCYKIILCCDEKNVGFYEKCGYDKKEVEMVHYFKAQ